METENRMVGAGGRGRRELFNRFRVLVWEEDEVLGTGDD